MAQQLSVVAEALTQQIGKEPQIIVEIEGVDLIFGVRPILKFIRWDEDDLEWDTVGFNWDSPVEDSKSRSWISLEGSAKNISQQIYPDKEGASSFSSANIRFIDFNGQMSKVLALNSITEILGKRASFYYGYANATHPEDSIPVLRGVITDYSSEPGSINLTITHPETLKRQSIYSQYTDALTSGIDNVVTTIPVSNTARLLETLDDMTSHIRIDDEIMEVTAKTANTITVIRGRFNTTAVSHDSDTEVVSNYRLQGNPINLALKLMLSNDGNTFETSTFTIKEFLNQNVFVDSYDIIRETGIVDGDTIDLGAQGLFTVSGSGTTTDGSSFIGVVETLIDDGDPGLTLSWKSQYNTLPDGLGMSTNEVSTIDFVQVQQFFGAGFVDYDFLLDETIEDAKDFISKEIFFPQAMYPIPRNARSSVRYLSPPLTIEQLPTLDDSNIEDIESVRLRRSTDKFFYNSILHKYGKSKRTGDFLATRQLISGDAVNTIPVGKKQLNIESQGLARTSATEAALDIASGRMLDRYEGAATYIQGVKLLAKAGLRLEPGDVVYFGGASTQFTDIDTGNRDAPIKKYEVINTSFNIQSFTPKVDLLDTGFSVVGVFAVFSPSSYVLSGSTTTVLKLGTFLDVCEVDTERQKWEPFVGANIRVRSEDYTYDETTVIDSLDPQDPSAIIISPALPSAAPADAIIELDIFDNLDDTKDITRDIKLRFTFTMDRAQITAVTSTTVFDVDDTTGMFVGAKVRVHSSDYVFDSTDNFEIIDITGSTITLDTALPSLPVIGYEIDVLDFSDQDGYRIL